MLQTKDQNVGEARYPYCSERSAQDVQVELESMRKGIPSRFLSLLCAPCCLRSQLELRIGSSIKIDDRLDPGSRIFYRSGIRCLVLESSCDFGSGGAAVVREFRALYRHAEKSTV